MAKTKFRIRVVAALSVATSMLVLTSAPASAANPTLTVTELSGSLHLSGLAIAGGDASPAMSTPNSNDIKPYTYGRFSVLWNLSNPDKKKIKDYTYLTYRCSSYADATSLGLFPTRCGTPQSDRRDPDSFMQSQASWTFSETFGTANMHKKWIRTRLRIQFTDGTAVQTFSTPRYYLTDTPRNEIPAASVRGADGVSVPQNRAMTMTFNQWSGLTEWNVGPTYIVRNAVVFSCTSRPVVDYKAFVSYGTTPTGCTRLVSNGLLEEHNGQAVTLSFTSGAKGTFIYALDSLAFNGFPTAGDVVYLQKRSVYTTYDEAELPNGPAAGSSTDEGSDLPNPLTALQAVGIDTGIAPIVSTKGQGTANGITAVINSNKSYTRSSTKRSLNITLRPKSSSKGSIVAALVSTKDGVDTVHLSKTRNVVNGKAKWVWRFPKTLKRGKYRLYVTFTPNDLTIPPMTLTKRVQLR